jgi:RNA polymerase-binding transcription factor DksA
MVENIDVYKKKLEEEKVLVERELGHIATKNPDNPEDWEPKPEDVPQTTADPNEMADRLEDFGERRSTEHSLEVRLNNIKRALKKIEEGTYGVCDVSGKEIPKDRLDANPASTTLAEHADGLE